MISNEDIEIVEIRGQIQEIRPLPDGGAELDIVDSEGVLQTLRASSDQLHEMLNEAEPETWN